MSARRLFKHFACKIVRKLLRPFAAAIPLVVISAAVHASTDLANIPINATSGAKPNLMLALDNSSSMNSDFLPDTARWLATSAAVHPCFMVSNLNRIYYNPNIVYLPGIDADGKSLPSSSYTSAPVDGYNPSSAKANLSVNFRLDANKGNPSGYGGGAYYVFNNKNLDPSACYQDFKLYTEVRIGAGEQQNFANWFSYYRTRMLATKSSISHAFSALDHNYRAGLWTINDNAGKENRKSDNFVPLGDFGKCPANAVCPRRTWFQTLFSTIGTGSTPLPLALRNVGEYFKTGRMPASTATVHPIQYMCQRNYAIVATDGVWNSYSSDDVGNNDNTVPAMPSGVPSPFTDTAYGNNGVILKTGSDFPPPFREGISKTSKTLADVAMKYWISDLRTDLDNEVPALRSDPATWQHMVTHAIGLGVNGDLAFNNATMAALTAGTIQWPTPQLGGASTIDDLWHATVNGHGQYFSAANASDLQDALAQILGNLPQIKSSSPLALSGQKRTDSSHVAYFSRYDLSDWSGELFAHAIDPANGTVDLANPIWAAHDLLNALPWDQRRFGSYSGAAGVAFAKNATGGLTERQLARLNSPGSASDHEKVINFLRGERAGEFNLRLGTGDYRKRKSVLGDNINAAPLFVPPPKANYADAGYLAFRAAWNGASNAAGTRRPDMIYLGSNDGMLHAFDAATGRESWAYVPGLVIDQPYVVTDPPIAFPDRSALVNLTMKSGFTHLYYADGTPVFGDVDLDKTAGASGSGPAWATLLVAGLNKGGRGYYALNVTDPVAASDAAVAGKVMWEFPNDATRAEYGSKVGYSYGKPIIVKTRKGGWVVLVTSGYNNGSDTGGDGQGRLFVLNARTGAVIKELVTGAGSAEAPSGLAHISAYVEQAEFDNTANFVYGGDLLGNVWRFDLSGEVEDWNTRLLAQLVDGSAAGVAQPITTAPELAKVKGQTMVLVATGRYLGASDAPGATHASPHDGQVQSVYGLIDDGTATPEITGLRTGLTQAAVLTALSAGSGTAISAGQNAGQNANVNTGLQAGTPANPTTSRGWYFDFARTNERALSDGVVSRGIFTVVTTLPLAADACKASAESFEYSINLTSGAVLRVLSLGPVFISAPTLVEHSDGSTGVIVVRSGQGLPAPRADPVPDLPGSATPKRLLWREIVDQE